MCIYVLYMYTITYTPIYTHTYTQIYIWVASPSNNQVN